MNKNFLFQSYMYCSHVLHIFSNYIVNMVVCICWIITDCLGVVQKLFGFPACILYSRPTHMEVYHATYTSLGGWRPSSRMCSPIVWDEARHTSRCWLQLNFTRLHSKASSIKTGPKYMPRILLNGLHMLQLPMHHPFMGRWATMTSIWCGFVPALFPILQKRLHTGTLW